MLHTPILDEIAIRTHSEVFHCRQWGIALPSGAVDELIQVAGENDRLRARLCMHPTTDDRNHQMLIAMSKLADDIPHSHPEKRECLVAVRGSADHVTYNALGDVVGTIRLAPDETAYLGVNAGVIHSLRAVTDWFVFWEFVPGPFSETSSIPAPWTA